MLTVYAVSARVNLPSGNTDRDKNPIKVLTLAYSTQTLQMVTDGGPFPLESRLVNLEFVIANWYVQ